MKKERDLLYIERFKSGDKDAFESLYQLYKRPILNYLYRMLNSRERAEDLTQETFIKVYKNLHKYKPTGSFSSWIYAISRNVAKNDFRRTNKQKNISIETRLRSCEGLKLGDTLTGNSMDSSEILENKILRRNIIKVLSLLPVKYREAIVLGVLQGISYEEAAKITKCTKSSFAIRLFRARKEFRRLFEKVHVLEEDKDILLETEKMLSMYYDSNASYTEDD